MRRSLSLATVHALLAGALLGCSGPHWSQPLALKERVPLSVWQSGGAETLISGGALGSGADALFLLGDDSGWRRLPTGTIDTLWWVFGLSATEAWTVGEHGAIYRWDGTRLTREGVPPEADTVTLYGVWGLSATDLWAVGGRPDADGMILHRDAAGWQRVPIAENTGAYFKVWGAAADDVFVCGQGGTILHWDGRAWSRQATGLPSSVSLFTVAGRAGNDVWAVGGSGSAVAIHHDGAAWQALSDPALIDRGGLAGVAIDSDGTVVMVGAGGTKLRGRPGALVDETEVDPVRSDLHATSIRAGEIFAVGGEYFAPAPSPRSGVVAHFGGDVPNLLR